MSAYILTVIRPDGGDYQYSTDMGYVAFDTIPEAADAIPRVFINHEIPVSWAEAQRVIREVRQAPAGTLMKHHATQFSFMIEEI